MNEKNIVILKKSKRKQIIRILIFTLVAFSLSFFLYFLSMTTNNPSKIKITHKKSNTKLLLSEKEIKKKIQKHLDETRIKNNINRDKILLNSYKNTPAYDFFLENKKPPLLHESSIDLSQEKHFEDLLSLIDNVDNKNSYYNDIEDEVTQYEIKEAKNKFEKINEHLKKIQASENQNQEFIKNFIINARKKGYIVKINKNLQVISVKRIKNGR